MIPGSVKGGIFLLLSVVGCIGNLFVILVVTRKRTLHTMHYFLLASLSLSDFLYHIFIIFFAVSQIAEQWIFGTAWCKGNFYILQCLVYTTILLLSAITWECHTAVVTPYNFSREITVKKITIVVLLWILSFVLGARPFLGWGRYVYNDKLYRCELKSSNPGNMAFTIVVFVVTPFGLITKQQYQMHRIAKRQKTQIAQQHHVINSNCQESQRRQRLRENLKVSKDALIIVLTFVVSYLPVSILLVLRRMLPENEEMNNALFMVAVLCIQNGATWNPMIYCYRKRHFRQQFREFLGVNTFRSRRVTLQMPS